MSLRPKGREASLMLSGPSVAFMLPSGFLAAWPPPAITSQSHYKSLILFNQNSDSERLVTRSALPVT